MNSGKTCDKLRIFPKIFCKSGPSLSQENFQMIRGAGDLSATAKHLYLLCAYHGPIVLCSTVTRRSRVPAVKA